jgi:hypothetical protein
MTPAMYSEAKDLVQVSSRDCMPLEHYAGSQTVQAKFFEVRPALYFGIIGSNRLQI